MAEYSKTTTEPIGGGVYQDTISLLQEEIQRLESELQLREDVHESLDFHPAPTLHATDHQPEWQLAELTTELANRDETIGLLWEQIQQFEAAEETRRAEWEQIHQWVEELESRVGGTSDGSHELRNELDDAQRRAQDLQDQLDAERRNWNAQCGCLKAEIETLRTRLAEAVQKGPDGPAQTALVQENQELRESCRRLAAAETAAADLEPLRAKLQATESELAQVRQELRRVTAEPAKAPGDQASIPDLVPAVRESGAFAKPSEAGLSPDARIRALRQHLKEIHEREEEERKHRQLSSRLARLWRRNNPA